MLALVLLAMAALVGLVFYVYNLGWQVNRRLDVQNSADAVGAGGGVWMARSMNLVAANNVEETRMLALVPALDSLPLATKMSHEETAAWADRLTEQVRDLQATWQDAEPCPQWLDAGLRSLEIRMIHERDILAAMDQQLDPQLNGGSFRMEDTTYWANPDGGGTPPHGAIWRAAVTLDELSQATAESAGLLAQAAAVQSGQENDVNAALLVPVLPTLPAQRGTFLDYQPPLEGKETVLDDRAFLERTGGNGGAIPDMVFPYRLGPWARLFPGPHWRYAPYHHWRHPLQRATAWEYVPGTGPIAGSQVRNRGMRGGGVRGASRTVGGSARGGQTRGQGGTYGHWRATAGEVYGYTTYGPYRWFTDRIHDWAVGWPPDAPGELADTNFYSNFRTLMNAKRGYVFTFNPPLKRIHYPEWITPYDEARRVALSDPAKVKYTMFYLVEVVSSIPENGPGWLSPGTFRTNSDQPQSMWWSRWRDPERWRLKKVADHVWKDAWQYETNYDPEIGIPWEGPLDGEGVFRPVYVVQFYTWGGIDIGGNVDVANPCNYQESDDLPAPILLDTSAGDYDPGRAPYLYESGDPPPPEPDAGWRRARFTFLGVARRDASSPVWSEKFANANPLGAAVAVAQVKVYNNKSWDLWTQDWQASLMPVRDWADWADRLEAGVADASATQGLLQEQDVQDLCDYVRRLPAPQADLYLEH